MLQGEAVGYTGPPLKRWYTMANLTHELQKTWHEEIPISQAMGIRVADFNNNLLTLNADLDPNINVHGTAFAGSLYAVCALCGWGSTWLQMKLRGIDASIVIAQGHIDYFQPVRDTIQTRCQFDEGEQEEALSSLLGSDRCRFQLVSEVYRGELVLASFSGSFAVKRAS